MLRQQGNAAGSSCLVGLGQEDGPPRARREVAFVGSGAWPRCPGFSQAPRPLPGVPVAPSVGEGHGGLGTEDRGLWGHLGDPVMAWYPLGCTQELGSSGPRLPKSQNSSSLLGSSPLHQVLSSIYTARNFRCIYLVCLISSWHLCSLPLTPTNGLDSFSWCWISGHQGTSQRFWSLQTEIS